MNKNQKAKILFGSVLVFVLAGLFWVPLAVAWSQAQQTDIEKANLVFSGDTFPNVPSEGQLFYRTDQTSLYLYNGTGWELLDQVSLSETCVVAKNLAGNFVGYTGTRQTIATNANSSYVFEQVIDYLRLTGGVIAARKAEFTDTHMIIPDGIVLTGEGNATVFTTSRDNINIFENEDQTGGNGKVQLKNFMIEVVGGSGQTGLKWVCPQDFSYTRKPALVVEDVFIKGGATYQGCGFGMSTGINLTGSGGEFLLHRVTIRDVDEYAMWTQVADSTFTRLETEETVYINGGTMNDYLICYFGGTTGAGTTQVYVKGRSQHFIYCINNHASGHAYDLDGADDIQIQGGEISECGISANNTYYGVYIHKEVENWLISGVDFNKGQQTNLPKYWIYESGLTAYGAIDMCSVQPDSYNYGPFWLGGDGTSQIGIVMGVRYQNNGKFEMNANSSVTFPHGLVGEPTGIWVTFNITNHGGYGVTKTATHITVTTTNSITAEGYWWATKDP